MAVCQIALLIDSRRSYNATRRAPEEGAACEMADLSPLTRSAGSLLNQRVDERAKRGGGGKGDQRRQQQQHHDQRDHPPQLLRPEKGEQLAGDSELIGEALHAVHRLSWNLSWWSASPATWRRDSTMGPTRRAMPFIKLSRGLTRCDPPRGRPTLLVG